QARAEINWADVTCSCGYFDQSHFVHDFNKFSGLNPSAYLNRCLEGEPNFVRAAYGKIFPIRLAKSQTDWSKTKNSYEIQTLFIFILPWRFTSGCRGRTASAQCSFGTFTSVAGENLERDLQRLKAR